jgi:hypothetical protein
VNAENNGAIKAAAFLFYKGFWEKMENIIKVIMSINGS